MADLNLTEKIAKKSLYEIAYEYLCDNFHKFKQQNKIKVAIAILNIFEKDDSKTKPDGEKVIIIRERFIERGDQGSSEGLPRPLSIVRE